MKKEFVTGSVNLHGSIEGDGDIKGRYIVKVKPVPEDGSKKTKYNCPICLALGFKHRVARTYMNSSCACCGVQFEWSENY